MDRPIDSSSLIRDSDPIDLPTDLSDLIYTYAPDAAISLDPFRRIKIVRLITGCQLIDRSPFDAIIILNGLAEENWDTLAIYSELYPYLRRVIKDRMVWNILLIHNPTIASLTELLEIETITLEEIRECNRSIYDSITSAFVSTACVKGDLSIIEELDRIGYRNFGFEYPEGADIWRAFQNTLIETKCPDLSKEMAKRVPDPINIITMLMDSEEIQPIVPELIRLHPNRLEDMMFEAVDRLKMSIALYLYQRHRIRIPQFIQNAPLELLKASIGSGCLSVQWSSSWRVALHCISCYNDNEKIEAVLEGCGVSKSWPYCDTKPPIAAPDFDNRDEEEDLVSSSDPIGPTSSTDPMTSIGPVSIETMSSRRLCPGVDCETIQTLIYRLVTPLLNRLPPDMIGAALQNASRADYIAFTDMKFDLLRRVEREPILRAASRLAILRGFQENGEYGSHPWIGFKLGEHK